LIFSVGVNSRSPAVIHHVLLFQRGFKRPIYAHIQRLQHRYQSPRDYYLIPIPTFQDFLHFFSSMPMETV
jgi:hypothetical protein